MKASAVELSGLDFSRVCISWDSERQVDLMKSITYAPEKVRPQSRSLRHLPLKKRSPDPAAARFFGYIEGLCGRG